MGLRVRKSIKLAPGVKLNVTEKGVSSVSVGKNGARVNISEKGTRTTVGINGTGVSYSHYQAHKKTTQNHHIPEKKQYSETQLWIALIIMIAFAIFCIYFVFFT